MRSLLNKHITAITLALLSSTISLVATETIASEEIMHMPFALDDASLPMANVDINGKRQTFMIDTGSRTALHLSKDVMAKLPGLTVAPEKERSTDLTGKVFLNDKFHIPQLSINGMIFKDVKGVSFTPRGMTLTRDSSLPNSMMIGLDLFKGKAVLIDYKNQRLSVADRAQSFGISMADGWISLPLRLTQEGIVVNVSQGSQSYNMVLDTGASVSVFWKARLKLPFASISCQTVIAEMDNEGCTASEFQLAEIGTENIKLNALLLDGTFEQMDTDGLIGNNFFKKFAVLIDFPAQRLLIKGSTHETGKN
ncbi:pepsin/retropepsin-like aspartic protease family protein [Serratia sp. DD3]|uniref:pepsin/retropepsin-like aspartic protease family protein n=1 Tax=Serratia sp. DD3 TaxID=1410619 RepID=UPI0004DB1843|nr:pepsin/retropepsin-like aspartic protease family protein [Serratia sp. DD3]KEY60667.1 retroviral aspartyl protease [Serratia sp. DD3]